MAPKSLIPLLGTKHYNRIPAKRGKMRQSASALNAMLLDEDHHHPYSKNKTNTGNNMMMNIPMNGSYDNDDKEPEKPQV